MSQSFQHADFENLANSFNRFVPEAYQIDAQTLIQKTTACPLFDWGASAFNNDGDFIAIKRSAASLYKGPDKDVAHITALAFHDPNAMVDLMNEAKRCLRNRGISKLQFGCDSAHLFPGCPIEFSALKDFLMIGGFAEGGEAHDLERDLATYENQVTVPEGDELRPVTPADLPELAKFFDREFPERWKYDVMGKIEAESSADTVFGLFHGSRCDGFALLQKQDCALPIGGAVWKRSLGPQWGSLGPIGIAADQRGKGSGNALLGKALEHLRDQGVRQCIIDWTGLVEFYGAHGFQVTRTYRYMTLDLEPSPLQ